MPNMIDVDIARAYAEEHWPSPVVRRHIDALLDGCPKVKAELPQHGEWVMVKTSFYHPYESEVEESCSLCGRCVYRYGTQPQDFYCPNCGAKMDGGAEDEHP